MNGIEAILGFPANVAVSSPLSAADLITATSVGQPGTAKHPPPVGKLADLGAIEIDEPLSKSPAVAKPDGCERDVR